MKEVLIFQENENYNLRRGTHLKNRNIHTAHFGTSVKTHEIRKCFIIISFQI